jgi:hypothetical protein
MLATLLATAASKALAADVEGDPIAGRAIGALATPRPGAEDETRAHKIRLAPI